MELTCEEQELVKNYRDLSAEGRRELAARVAALAAQARGEAPKCQCALPEKEQRPEAAKEPLFTE